MKKIIYTKNYKIEFIKNWLVCMDNEVKIKVMETYNEKYEGFNEEYHTEKFVEVFYLNTLNGGIYTGSEIYEDPSSQTKRMVRKEWKKIRKEFEGGKRLQYDKY